MATPFSSDAHITIQARCYNKNTDWAGQIVPKEVTVKSRTRVMIYGFEDLFKISQMTRVVKWSKDTVESGRVFSTVLYAVRNTSIASYSMVIVWSYSSAVLYCSLEKQRSTVSSSIMIVNTYSTVQVTITGRRRRPWMAAKYSTVLYATWHDSEDDVTLSFLLVRTVARTVRY